MIVTSQNLVQLESHVASGAALGNFESFANCDVVSLAGPLSAFFLPKPVVPGERAKRVRVPPSRDSLGLGPSLSLFPLSLQSFAQCRAVCVWRSHGAEYTTNERTNYGVQTVAAKKGTEEQSELRFLLTVEEAWPAAPTFENWRRDTIRQRRKGSLEIILVLILIRPIILVICRD